MSVAMYQPTLLKSVSVNGLHFGGREGLTPA